MYWGLKLTVDLHLVPKSRMVDRCLLPIDIHGKMFNYVSTETTLPLYILKETYRDMLGVASSSRSQHLRQPSNRSMQSPRAALWDKSVRVCKCTPSSLHPGTPVCRHDWWLVSQCMVLWMFSQWHKFKTWASISTMSWLSKLPLWGWALSHSALWLQLRSYLEEKV
jgi:hypothetical protein